MLSLLGEAVVVVREGLFVLGAQNTERKFCPCI